MVVEILNKLLKTGNLYIDNDRKVVQIKSLQSSEHKIEIAFDKINSQSWGYIYEKFVGQHLESKGFIVEYTGLNKGVCDGGIDLIVDNGVLRYFIQCKYYTKKKIGKTAIENILYKAGNTISKQAYSKKDYFILVIPNKDSVFRRTKIETYGIQHSYQYPIYDYFLSKNHTQNEINLDIFEIPM